MEKGDTKSHKYIEYYTNADYHRLVFCHILLT